MTRISTMALLGMLGTVACTEPVKGDDVLTSEMVATLDVTSDGGTSTATAAFTYGSGFPVTYVQLGVADTLTVTGGELEKSMGELVLDDLISYVASFDLIEVDTPFLFSLERELDAGALSSTATLPPPFEITSAEPATFSRGAEDLTVTWTGEVNTADALTLVVDGDCIDSYEEALPQDLGTVTIPAGNLVSTTGQEAESCEITVWLKRQRNGELDAAFAGGTIAASQYRTTDVIADP